MNIMQPFFIVCMCIMIYYKDLSEQAEPRLLISHVVLHRFQTNASTDSCKCLYHLHAGVGAPLVKVSVPVDC